MNMEKPICMELIGTVNMMRRAMAEEEKNEYGLSGILHWVLGYIYRHESEAPIFQKDIERVFELSRSSASEVLQKMEKLELIERISTKEDRRLKKIVLLPKGAEACESFLQTIRSFDRLAERGILDEEKQQLRKILQKIRENILKDNEKEKRGVEVHAQKTCKKHS